ncbi:MAG: glycerophosphoryl diester phosphodiesterase membrane domain-containing protein [Caldilineaceae bacterium]
MYPAIVSGIITGNAMTGYMDFIESMVNNPSFDPGDSPEQIIATVLTPLSSFFGALLLVGLIGMVVQGLATLALTQHHLKTLQREETTTGDSIQTGARRLLPYIGMMLLEGLTMLGLVLAVGLIFACAIGGLAFTSGMFDGAAPFDGNPAGIAGLVILFVCLYIIALLIMAAPIIYFWCRWLVATPCLINEQLGPVAALRRSWRLSKGHVWRVIGYGILLYILGMIIVSAPAYVFQQIALVFIGTENVAAATGIATAVSALFSVIWQPFLVGAIVLFYYDLRIRKEGYDLELRVQQLEAGSADDKVTG